LKDTHYIADLAHWGVKFFSYQEPFLDTTETGELLLGIFSWIAKQEAKKISERTKAGLDRARQQGKRLGRAPIEFDTAKAEQLRASGASLRMIAKELGCSHVLVKERLAKRSVGTEIQNKLLEKRTFD
jgi:DNA invertase Pin-like site-specific DNA recombinase